MTIGRLALATFLLATTRVAVGATVLYAPLEQFDGWDLNTLGTARIAAPTTAADLPCVEMNSAGGIWVHSRIGARFFAAHWLAGQELLRSFIARRRLRAGL